MAQRRSPNRVPTIHLARKTSSTRRLPSSRKRAFVNRLRSHALGASRSPPSSDALRPVLVPLHPNLRRLPARLLLAQKETMRDASHGIGAIKVGTKRKRVFTSNENAHTGGRPTRGSGRLKRQKSTGRSSSTDEEETSVMDIDDTPPPWVDSDASDEESDEAVDSSDDHLINDAPPRQLLRLRKDELVGLYTAAGLTDDAELLTKPDIVAAIVAARDDVAELPPSSPPGRGPDSSEYSSDDGNVAGDEETDFGVIKHNSSLSAIKRRATINDLGRTNSRPPQNRSLSLGHMQTDARTFDGKKTLRVNGEVNGRRKLNGLSRSLPTTSNTHHVLPSPPATRTRSRKVSEEMGADPRIRTKGKQVEFREDVQVSTPPRRMNADESDVTYLGLGTLPAVTPSPRRLRSKGSKDYNGLGIGLGRRAKVGRCETVEEVEEFGRRVTPARRAKRKVRECGEDGLEVEEEQVEEDELVDDEVDELSSAAPPAPRGRRTPVKRRLRPRRVQTSTPPSDGDDEGEDEEREVDDEVVEEVDESVDGDEAEESAGGEESEESVDGEETGECADGEEVEGSVDGEANESAEEVIAVEPRRLRNGKIVGEDDTEEDIGEEDDDEEEEEEAEEAIQDVDEDVDLEAEGETEDEVMDDVDLTVATAKTLVRLRRDDLVKMCEARELDIGGTKPQLAEALLQWRDSSGIDFPSPSSNGTIRPPSTSKPKQRKSQSQTPPVLMRADRFHADEPRTPPLKDAEPELELDLESLGLEDREIPPEKLTKLEKIGSGGFKDVFIGKFKGRKIAISEFRGQLSAMDIKELKLLGGFDHSNIVRFLGVSIPEYTRETPVMIVSELCSNGDLFDYVRNVDPPSLYRVLSMMLDIARGLEYLHLRKPSVIHRDCKSSNILITSKGTAKIADFGLAKVKQSTRSMVRSLVGTVNWQAPELWHAHPKYNHKVDVFSCAMVFWEMLQWHYKDKKFPWEGMNEHAIYEIVGAKRQRPSVSGLRKLWCPEIVDLVERMWAHDHENRPSMSDVVEDLEQLIPTCR